MVLNSWLSPDKPGYGLRIHTLPAMTTWNSTWTTLPSGLATHGHDFNHGPNGMAEMSRDGDAVEAYFECISTCSLDDAECITVCTMVLRENN
jgi:hypothetical protein